MLKARDKMEEGMHVQVNTLVLASVVCSAYAAVDSSNEAEAISKIPTKEASPGI